MYGIILLIILLLLTLIYLLRIEHGKRKVVAIIVLGDIGRSPRMQYHSCSLAEEGFEVYMIGYGGSTPHPDVVENPHIHLRPLPANPGWITCLPRLLQYVFKVVYQVAVLCFSLLTVPKPSHMLMQNPPALPCMAVCWLACLVRGSRLVIDWHNYGYTILALSLGNNHPLVKAATLYERYFGRLSHHNICVTAAMKLDLRENWGIQAVTMYDRPPAMFREASLQERHDLFVKLKHTYPLFAASEDDDDSSRFTARSPDGSIELRRDRPVLLISSTSWTEDEDFSILLSALETYELAACSDSSLREVVCVITGKGPQKQHYLNIIAGKHWTRVAVCTPWLEAQDYPVMLGCGDVGVCLHTSSSGLDLPMKVVDMFGCGLPVCAIHFNCLSELVEHEKNGLVFHTAEQLAQQIMELVRGFPEGCEQLKAFRNNLHAFQKIRWQESWQNNVKPIFVQT